jgi:ubiquinone/menaquinone biosynthesis C-methylase UbiE
MSIRKKYLKTFGGLALSVSMAATTFSLQGESGFGGRQERSVAIMYDQDDLSTCSLFAGHFINFGFWKQPVKSGFITVAQRIESEKNLYRLVMKRVKVGNNDRVLEVGCGQGVGSVLTVEEFSPKEMHGIDFSEAQISRAKEVNQEAIQKNPGRIFFQRGAAENIPYEANRFEKVFSIEAAQHFENLDLFVREVRRVLTPGGRLAIACFFGTAEKSQFLLNPMIQTIRNGIDKATPISHLEAILKKNDFKNVQIESIGKNVWYGYDQWVAQGDLKDSWTRNWYKGYQKGLIDYYLITAEKPASI